MSVSQQWAARSPGSRLRCASTSTTGRRGSAARRSAAAASNDVVITSYDVATRDGDLLAAITWDRLLLDEAQDVKSRLTKRHRALRRVPRTDARAHRHADREPPR